jgi:hypothetical protein
MKSNVPRYSYSRLPALISIFDVLFNTLTPVEASPYDQQHINAELQYLRSKLDDWPAKAEGSELQQLRRRFEDTVRAMEELAKKRPREAEAAWMLGECCRMGNNIDVDKQYVAASKESFDRVLEIDPGRKRIRISTKGCPTSPTTQTSTTGWRTSTKPSAWENGICAAGPR